MLDAAHSPRIIIAIIMITPIVFPIAAIALSIVMTSSVGCLVCIWYWYSAYSSIFLPKSQEEQVGVRK
ncbi:hypothetical protein ACFL3M_02060 [Patescibacteria group bacterium]